MFFSKPPKKLKTNKKKKQLQKTTATTRKSPGTLQGCQEVASLRKRNKNPTESESTAVWGYRKTITVWESKPNLGHPKPSKTLFLVPKSQVFVGGNLCFSWFWVLLEGTTLLTGVGYQPIFYSQGFLGRGAGGLTFSKPRSNVSL